jgi:endonuclease III
VRGPDAVDFGIWRSVPPSALVIPLDTHVARMARNLRLTSRRDLGWRTAEQVTASLRRLDPMDPVKYDFALCHYGMSGMCPTQPIAENCTKCLLLPACRVGPAVVRRATVRSRHAR